MATGDTKPGRLYESVHGAAPHGINPVRPVSSRIADLAYKLPPLLGFKPYVAVLAYPYMPKGTWGLVCYINKSRFITTGPLPDNGLADADLEFIVTDHFNKLRTQIEEVYNVSDGGEYWLKPKYQRPKR
jgi:hypothetical protein